MIKSAAAFRGKAFRTRAGRLLFFCILSLAAPAHAEVYKWTDGQGKVHYSDQPPTVEALTIKSTPSGQAVTTREATQALNAREQDYQKRRKDAEDARAKAEKEAEQARIRRENCDRARNNLDNLQNKSRVYTTNAASQRVYLDEAARASALASSQKAISENCK